MDGAPVSQGVIKMVGWLLVPFAARAAQLIAEAERRTAQARYRESVKRWQVNKGNPSYLPFNDLPDDADDPPIAAPQRMARCAGGSCPNCGAPPEPVRCSYCLTPFA